MDGFYRKIENIQIHVCCDNFLTTVTCFPYAFFLLSAIVLVSGSFPSTKVLLECFSLGAFELIAVMSQEPGQVS